jgi:hypothetical protein
MAHEAAVRGVHHLGSDCDGRPAATAGAPVTKADLGRSFNGKGIEASLRTIAANLGVTLGP